MLFCAFTADISLKRKRTRQFVVATENMVQFDFCCFSEGLDQTQLLYYML